MKHTIKSRRSTSLALAVSAVLLATSACGSDSDDGGNDSNSTAGKADVKLVMIQSASAIPYEQQEAAGAKAGAKAAGVSLELTGPSTPNAEQQISMLQQAVTQKPDGILIQELPPALFVRPVELAEDAGITVLPFQIAPDATSTSKTFVGGNDLELGRQAGQAVADAIIADQGAEAEGDILMATCFPGLVTLDNRVAGFTEAIEQALPNVTVLEPFKTSPDATQAYSIWASAVQTNPDFLSAYSPCEGDTQALIKIRTDENGTWPLVGHDPDDITIKGVTDGQVLGLYPISPYQHGYLAAYILGTALKNGDDMPEGWIPEDSLTIDESNVGEVGAPQIGGQGAAEFWQPYIDAILEKPDYGVQPLADATS